MATAGRPGLHVVEEAALAVADVAVVVAVVEDVEAVAVANTRC